MGKLLAYTLVRFTATVIGQANSDQLKPFKMSTTPLTGLGDARYWQNLTKKEANDTSYSFDHAVLLFETIVIGLLCTEGQGLNSSF